MPHLFIAPSKWDTSIGAVEANAADVLRQMMFRGATHAGR
jgi:hypothetical protein